jgi:ferrous iron transport protein A
VKKVSINKQKLLTTNSRERILTDERKGRPTKSVCKGWNPEKRKEDVMMPLSMMREGEKTTIKKIGGKEETRKFLENLGFVTGGEVTVVSEISGSLIVNVKDSRVAIGKDMANKIMV